MKTRRFFISELLMLGVQGMRALRSAASPRVAQPQPQPAPPPPPPLPLSAPETLDEVIAKVRQMNREGSSHAQIAQWLSQIIDARISAPNKLSEIITMSSQQKDAWNRLADAQLTYDQVAKESWKAQVGQCGEHAVIAYYVIKQAGLGGNPRILSIGGDHTHEFVVLDMAPGANSEDPRTWGDQAVVVDGWQGYSMDSKEAWTDGYISDQGSRRMTDKTAARPGLDGWDVEAPLWQVDERNKDSLTRIPGAKSGCFIATAAFGTAMAPQLDILRGWRNEVLMRSAAGRALAGLYCRVSPPVARLIARHDRLRAGVRALLNPAVRLIAGAGGRRNE